MKTLLLVAALIGVANCWPSWLGKEAKCGLTESMSLFDQSISEKSDARKDDLIFMTEFARFMNYKAPYLLQEFSQRKKLSEGKEKLRRRHFQTEFKDTLRKLEVITELLANQKRQKRSQSINIEARQDVVDAVVDAVEDTADVSAEVVEGAVDAVVDVVDDTADAVVDVADGAAESAGGVVDEVADAADGVVDGAGDVVGAVGDLGETAGDLVGDLIGVLTDSTTGVIDTFTDVVQSVGDALQENLPPSVWNAMCVATWWPLQEDHCEAARCVACAPAITTAASVCKNTGLEITHKCLEEVMDEGFCNFCIKTYLEL